MDKHKMIIKTTGNFEKIIKSINTDFLENVTFIDSTSKIEYHVLLDFVSFNRLGSDESCYWNDIVNYHKGLFNVKKDRKDIYSPKPVITIGWFDILNEINEEFLFYLNPNRKFAFLDSSIWNFYVPLEGKNFKERLESALESIKNNFNNDLYNLNVSIEFIEFQIRLMFNSFLIDIDGHSNYISPFVFHSEQRMKKMADRELEVIEENTGTSIKWNFLLIDDYAEKKLAGTTKDITKLDIIKKIVNTNNFIEKKEYKNKNTAEKVIERMTFESVYSYKMLLCKQKNEEVICYFTEKLEKCKEIKAKGKCNSLHNNIYDVILLDYLLGDDYTDGAKTGNREYGHDLIVSINNLIKNNESLKKGPMNTFWFFPVSVFANAMLDRLREQGISHISEHWYISRGADPINTPHLFRYNLFQFLKLQIDLAHYEASHIVEFIRDNPISNIEGSDKVRKWAKTVLGSFLYRFGKKEILEMDSNNHSKFAKSMLKYIKDEVEDAQIYDYVKELLYLLAYRTNHNALEMLELFRFIETHNAFKSTTDKNVKDVLDAISEYIVKLN